MGWLNEKVTSHHFCYYYCCCISTVYIYPLVMRAIGVSHTACKDEFRRNLRSHSWWWSVFSFFIISGGDQIFFGGIIYFWRGWYISAGVRILPKGSHKSGGPINRNNRALESHTGLPCVSSSTAAAPAPSSRQGCYWVVQLWFVKTMERKRSPEALTSKSGGSNGGFSTYSRRRWKTQQVPQKNGPKEYLVCDEIAP